MTFKIMMPDPFNKIKIVENNHNRKWRAFLSQDRQGVRL